MEPHPAVPASDSDGGRETGVPAAAHAVPASNMVAPAAQSLTSTTEYCAFLEHKILRLSNVLAEYQQRYDAVPLGDVDSLPAVVDATGLNVPAWLLDKDRLEPLLTSYDRQIAERDVQLEMIKADFVEMQAQTELIIQENSDLQAALTEYQEKVDVEDFQDMREHVALLLEENKLLLDQQLSAGVHTDAVQAAAQRGIGEVTRVKQKLARTKKENGKLLAELLALRKSATETARELAGTADELQATQRQLQLAEREIQSLGNSRNSSRNNSPKTAFEMQDNLPRADVYGGQPPPMPGFAGDDAVEIMHGLAQKYRLLENEHELAVTAIADLQTGLQRSHNREKKLRSTLAALVDATQETEQGAAQNAHMLKRMAKDGRRKDRVLKRLVIKLQDQQNDADATKVSATRMVQEATQIVQAQQSRPVPGRRK